MIARHLNGSSADYASISKSGVEIIDERLNDVEDYSRRPIFSGVLISVECIIKLYELKFLGKGFGESIYGYIIYTNQCAFSLSEVNNIFSLKQM